MPIETSLCNLYVDCVNDQLDAEALFRMLIKDDSGCPTISVIGSGGGGLPVGLATEATLQALLTELNKDFDFEIKCVRDTVSGIVYILRIQKDETDGSITIDYIDATGAVIVPPVPGNLVVCDASAALGLILAQVTGAVTTNVVVNTAVAGNVPAGHRRGSVLNIGANSGTWNGAIIPAGVGLPFGGTGKNDTGTIIAYDPTTGAGTSFLIEYDI